MDGLEKRDGVASFVYNAARGLPWHRMGFAVDGDQPVEVMCKQIGADFTAYKAPIHAMTNEGMMEITDKVAIVADRPIGEDGKIVSQVFGVLGDGYEIVQYQDVAEKAVAIVGASKGQAVIDTMGLLFDGKRFFAYINLGSVFLDPKGINDEILRGLLLHSSHDGSIAVTYAETDTRAVCANTVRFGIETAVQVYKAKHTLSVQDRMTEAEKVMGFQAKHTEALIREAEALLRVPFTEDGFTKVLKRVFPTPPSATARQERNVDEIHAHVRGLFINDRNSGKFGENGWTMYNSITEYLDHNRKASEADRAVSAMTPGTWVEKRKLVAAKAIADLGGRRLVSV